MGHKKNKYNRSSRSQPNRTNASDRKKKPQPYQPRIQTDEELIDQVLQVEHLHSLTRDKLNKVEHHCYLLSSAWFRSWKEYTGYSAYVKGIDRHNAGQNPQEAYTFGKCRPEPVNSDIVSKLCSEYAELPKGMEEYSYLTGEVDPSMELNKDFILVDADLWYYFEAKYTGRKIYRPIKRTKGKPTRFDVELVDFRFVALTDQQLFHFQQLSEEVWKASYEELVPIRKLQIPAFWTLTDLREFVVKYLHTTAQFQGSPATIEFWKYESLISDKDIKISMIQTVRKNNFNFLGRVLHQEEKEGYELADFLKGSHVLFVKFGQINFKQISLKALPVSGNCEACLTKHSLQVTCSCKRVLYCSKKCAAQDKSFHQRTCQFAYQSDDDEEYQKKQQSNTDNTKCGLVNLGNTCYMNSALQCLANIPSFAHYFLLNAYQQEFDKKEFEANKGIFLKKFAKLLKKYCEQDLLQPWSIKTQINHFLPQFGGYKQHDSSEFLLALLNTINDSLEKQNKEHGYSRLLCDTFLGWFQSKIMCPECGYETNNHEPFLSVPLPIKEQKQASQEIEYVQVESWKKYRRGFLDLTLDWVSVSKELGIDLSARRMVGVEGTELSSVSNDSTLSEIASKHPKEEIVFYPKSQPPSEEQIDIQVGLAYMHNQAKSPYGYPLFVRVSLNSNLYEIYMQIAQTIGLSEEVQQQLEQFVVASTQKIEQTTNEKEARKVNAEIAEEFEERFTPLLKFQLVIVSNKRSKKACLYCHRKCAWCVLPFSFMNTVEDYIALGQKAFRLELVFSVKVEMDVLAKPSSDRSDGITTLQECLELFNQPEILDEDNFWFCTVCQAPRLATKIMSVSKLPAILVLQLKRFREQGGHKIKNNDPVRYPEVLNFQGSNYRFNSAIVHEGSLEGGHYWTICQKQDGYFIFNDDVFKPTDGPFSPNAYILLYQRM